MAPDTMTSWIASGFAVSDKDGLGIAPLPSKVCMYLPEHLHCSSEAYGKCFIYQYLLVNFHLFLFSHSFIHSFIYSGYLYSASSSPLVHSRHSTDTDSMHNCICTSRDVNKDLTPKDQDKDLTPRDQDKDKDLTPKDQDKDLLDLTPKDNDKDKDLAPKDQDKDKDLKYVLKESLRTRTTTRTTARQPNTNCTY